jgi:hypothetical protein
MASELLEFQAYLINFHKICTRTFEFKHVLNQLKFVNSSITDVMLTKFQIIISILLHYRQL